MAKMKPGRYIQTTSCGEHSQHGPYKNEDARVKAAQEAWAGEGDFDFSQETDDIERLDVAKDGSWELSPFSGGEVDPD